MKELITVAGVLAMLSGTAITLIACREPPPPPRITFDRHCSMEQSERVAKFIVDCAEAANPKSDEEGEDLVEQCEETAKNVLCPEVAFVSHRVDGVWTMSKACSQVKEPELAKACRLYMVEHEFVGPVPQIGH